MPIVEGIDPELTAAICPAIRSASTEKRFAVIRELWDRVRGERTAGRHQVSSFLRRNFQRGFLLMAQISELAAKYVGGVTVLRDVAGSGRQPLTPVDADKQRRAESGWRKTCSPWDSFKFKPDFSAN